MSFFVTETKLSLRKTEQFIFNGLLAAIFVGAGVYTAIVVLEAVFARAPLVANGFRGDLFGACPVDLFQPLPGRNTKRVH